jgi:DNA-binding response OmpR family regulator
MSERVLIIDDDVKLAELVGTFLGQHGYEVRHEATATAGRLAVSALRPDAVLLDVMLPDGDGMDLCRQLRADPSTATVPILMLTARGDDTDRIVGLELGADDYLPKPFNPRELVARLKAVLRRTHRLAPSEVLRFGDLQIDKGARVVRLRDEERPLTQHQFELLVALAERAGRVVSRNQLMVAVRGDELEAFDRSIDVHISRIRSAIEDDPKHPRRIVTVRGAGYLFTGGEG